MSAAGSRLPFLRRVSAYLIAVCVGGYVGAMIFFAVWGEFGLFASLFGTVTVLPFLMIAALPFTALAMLVIWALKLRGWEVFVLTGALCSPTILFLFHKFMGSDLDYSVHPARELPYQDFYRLAFWSLLFAPAGAVAGWVFWRLGFRLDDGKKEVL
ncbi:hypothetical protein [Aquamicrobium zhengzhouense]|uniref:Uncharacterized protein n=1 Tax=Aquamicrobium zhengzhouense TaxID=2781738 RepID=A0ABS0S709_9HYPH|nr:hypothetical protein [Aquamicrobium zhengzhouense]MBI1619068.1 hypothetical protein [Aquamicrobium zhengzhouense]